MKKTKYFVSKQVGAHDLVAIVNEMEEKRNTFIESNLESIGEIENEQIQIVTTSNNSNIQAILSLTYYPKP